MNQMYQNHKQKNRRGKFNNNATLDYLHFYSLKNIILEFGYNAFDHMQFEFLVQISLEKIIKLIHRLFNCYILMDMNYYPSYPPGDHYRSSPLELEENIHSCEHINSCNNVCGIQ